MNASHAGAAVLALHFGEPETSDLAEVTDFLERIFFANARLEPGADRRARSRELAERRAPGLIEDYERIGGSPLNGQARSQAALLSEALSRRGAALPVETGMQFTHPTIDEALARLRERDPARLVLLPVYPLCGPSTTVAALSQVEAALEAAGWNPETLEVTGWHRHPDYGALRANAIRRAAEEAGLDLGAEDTRLVFSAHGTPLSYVREGSRYVEYVEEWCADQAGRVGVERWTLGYQNHANRGVEWTQPSIEDAIAGLEGVDRVLVDPVSFMHEQSETLVELDHDLAGDARSLDLDFHRVPVPHSDDAFGEVLADLVLAALGEPIEGLPERRSCRCRPGATLCFNGDPPA